MSSETSIDASVAKRPTVAATRNVGSGAADSDALQPWQLFTLAGLAGATAVVFVTKDTGPAGVILLSITVAASAWLGLAAWRTLAPLFGFHGSTTTEVLGGRTRAALEREKLLVLRAIKDLEFDRAMGKVAEKDFAEMSARLRSRAAVLIRQLDRGAGYREEIEREITKRLGGGGASRIAADPTVRGAATAPSFPPARACACGASNDVDARFCKSCGSKLAAA
jgi:hypothetical protein